MIGDEIMVVSTEGIHDFGSPVLYKPYVVVGLKHRQRENWQGPETDTTYYQIEPIGMTDEERTGAMLAGGGRARPMYIFPSPSEYRGSDQWILRPGFLRGELEEGGETNEAARTLSKARKAGVDTYYPKSAVKANPERFRKYTRDKYLKEEKEINPKLKVGNTIRVIDVDGEHKNMPERFKIYKVVNVSAYDKNNFIYDLVSPDLDLEKVSTFDSRGVPIFHSKNLYRGDTWIKIDRTIKEHDQPGLSPELEIGDVIKVIDIDRERERGKTQYTTPGEQMRPEKFVPYTVVDKKSNGSQSKWSWKYTLVPPNQVEAYEKSLDRGWGNYEGYEKLLYPWIYEWIYANTSMANKVDRLTISENKEELNQRVTMGDVIRVIDVDKESTYEQPTDEDSWYDYNTGNASGNSLMTNHHREQVHGQDTYPRPMKLYMVMSKSTYRPKDRDYLNPYWLIWPVDKDGKIEDRKDLHQPILTEKDTWIIVKKHKSNIPGDMEKKQKEYDDSGRDIISRRLGEQDEPGFDEFSDAELEKRRTYDDFSDDEKAEIDQERIDTTPFTPLEIRILKTLHKNLDRSELQKLSTNTPEAYGNLDKKFWNVMKLFGIEETDTEQNTRESRYAKWALDNWNEEGDYNIENPIKVPLKWYDIEREESGSQIEYKSGEAEVLGFDEDDAGERADYDFYAWGGEMETNDYGDYESYDSEITNSNFIKMDEGLSRVLREDIKPQTQELLFNFWRKVGPTLDPNKLKLVGFNMDNNDDKRVVWDNLKEYYGDEGLNDVIDERLEGLHDSWSYEYIVTNAEWNGDDITLDILVNGDTQIPVTQELGGAIDMSLWDINENETGDYQNDDIYEEVRDSISSDIEGVLLQDLPVYMNLDYMDISEPGTFETYVKENELEIIREEDDGYIDDMVYIDEPREKHIRRMGKGLGSLTGFPVDNYKNVPPPENESNTTEDEIGYLEGITIDKNLVDSADELRKHFTKFLESKGLEYPKQEMKKAMQGVKAIILILKYYYNRPRPWQIAQAKGLVLNSETLQSSSSPSYPSGHATQGRFVARYLSDLYPEYGNELMEIGDEIAFSRNMAKVHYPSDSAFGKILGDDMYDFISNNTINEQVVMDKGDMLKADIFKILTSRFTLTPTDHSQLKDAQGNYYRLIDIENPDIDVNLSDLIEPIVEFVNYGVETGDFKEEDVQKAIKGMTDWISLMMNQKKEYLN